MSEAPAPTWRLGDPDGLQIEVGALGACWRSCRVPVAGGRREVLLATAATDPLPGGGGYIGSVVGRVANRIAGARFELGGREHRLIANEGRHQLHGGPGGFHARVWQAVRVTAESVSLVLHSPAGDQGFPGALQARVDYRVDAAAAAVQIDFSAEVDEPTPVAMTSHAYLNLDGDAADVRRHRLRVAAAQVLPVDAEMIPLAGPLPVAGTPFDLRNAVPLPTDAAAHPQLARAGGLDHAFLLDAACAAMRQPAAELQSADGRLAMQLFTDYPSLQVYSGQHLVHCRGRDGRVLPAFAGLALEPQMPPDAVNRPAWRALGLLAQPGRVWRRSMRLRFLAEG